MSIEKVIEKATINFPRPLSLQETERVLEHVAKELPATITYHISAHKSLYHEAGSVAKNDGTIRIRGSISNLQKPMTFDSFRSEPHRRETNFIASISFNLILGYDLEDYGPEVLKLWDDVRRVINQYFKNK